MAPIPLSQLKQLVALADRRAEFVTQLDRASRLVSVAAYFANDGTASEPLPDHLVPQVKTLLIYDTQQRINEIDAQLRALDVDPEH